MKNILIVIHAFLMISCQTQHNNDPINTQIELNKNWLFSEAGSNYWYPADVPGSIHTDMLANGLIGDPFYRLNEHQLQWIDKKDWEYKTIFTPEDQVLNSDRIEMQFDGLDTYADIYLNDSLVLVCDNMFRKWSFECNKLLKEGENELRIVFHSPTLTGEQELIKFGFALPASNDQSENGEMGDKRVSVFVRKAPYHFGWDWGPRLVSSGIWRPVRLIAWNTARIENMRVYIDELDEKEATLLANLKINSLEDKEAVISIRINGNEIKQLVQLEKGIKTYPIRFSIKNPQLWWPNGLGEHPLYSVQAVLQIDDNPADRAEKSIGLRTIELVREKDTEGESFYFTINGRPVFAKGANYIPNDVFPARVSDSVYKNIVLAAAESNMNLLRVWGGGIYENDMFYDLCDQNGILVWQDFMFACAMYPGNDEFIENVKLEAIETVNRLADHPCLALWCGNNEIEVAWAEYNEKSGWGWKEQYNEEQRKKIWKAYDTLFHHVLPEVVSSKSKGQAYWHSSPSAGMGQLSTYKSTSGDMHYWGVWHGGDPFSDFTKYKARFMSEYGFQSFPEFESIEKYTLPEDLNVESEVMASHQRSGIGNLRIKQYMQTEYQVPDDFEQFIYVGQLLQAEAIKTAIEAHRSEMPYCMGSLYWQLNDCWPVASWSGIDYFGKWKALQFFVKKSFENTILTSFEENDSVVIRCISDVENTNKARLILRLTDYNGLLLWSDSLSVEIPDNEVSVLTTIPTREILTLGNASSIVLVSELKTDNTTLCSDLHYFTKPKDLKLDNPEMEYSLSESDSDFIIKIKTNKLVKNVYFTAKGLPGKFSDNFFDMLPQQEYLIYFPKKGSLQDFERKLKLIHLQQTIKKEG